MKNIIIIVCFLTYNFASSQTAIYPLNTNAGDIPDNAYLKDLNNELDKYVGLWKGNWNGKTVYLELRKIKEYYDGNHPFYVDRILGERKIINSNGNIEIDRITNFAPDGFGAEFSGIGQSLKNGNWKRLYFSPKDMCNKRATLDITSFTGNSMTLHFEYLPSIFDPNCIHNSYVDQYGDFPMNFPKDITLTKQ